MFTIRHRHEAHDPVPDEHVACLLDAAAAPAEPGPAPGEAAALAAFRAAHESAQSRSSRMLSSHRPLRTAAAAALGTGVLLTGGVAAAQAGSLPAPAQDVARTMLAKIGVTVPGADAHATGHAGQRGPSEAPGTSVGGSETGTGADAAGDHADKRSDIAEMATHMDGGVDKGAAISAEASDQHSRAGEEHGKPDAPGSPASGSAAEENAGITTPNNGGSSRPEGTGTTAGQAPTPVTPPDKGTSDADHRTNGDASAFGRSTADTASGHRSATGSDDASGHRRDNRP